MSPNHRHSRFHISRVLFKRVAHALAWLRFQHACVQPNLLAAQFPDSRGESVFGDFDIGFEGRLIIDKMPGEWTRHLRRSKPNC
jgi:hypothetical protein